MRINIVTLNDIQKNLGQAEALAVTRLSARQQALELKWQQKLDKTWKSITREMLQHLEKTGEIRINSEQMEQFFVEHAFAVMLDSLRTTGRMPQVPNKTSRRLASYPKGPMPRSLKSLRELWDRWRKKGEVPPRQRVIVEKVKKAYIKKCQDTWRKYSDIYSKRAPGEKQIIIEKVGEAAWTEFARSETIVETETTRYWNQIRKDVYGSSPDVTHFLFVPIRDLATTKWCRSRRMLVYAKVDPILERETPPIHWRCRSELLPLTPLNPKHRALIEDKSRARRNHKCEPLPAGWNS